MLTCSMSPSFRPLAASTSGSIGPCEPPFGTATDLPLMSATDLRPSEASAVTWFGLPCRIVAMILIFAPAAISRITGAESAKAMSTLPAATSCAVICEPLPGSIFTSIPASL